MLDKLGVQRERLQGLNLFVPRNLLVAAVVFGCLLYIGLFAFPKRVSFSYASATCTGGVVILPGMHAAADSSQFRLQYQGGVSVGKTQLITTKVCFVPAAAPRKGVVRVASAPFGGWAFRAPYDVVIGAAPQVVNAKPLAQAVGQPLKLALTKPDKVFHYQLVVGDKSQPCTNSATQLVCGSDKLGLVQGATYAVGLQRSYEGKPVGVATPVQVVILPAIKVADSSIKPGETVFAKPKSLVFTVDKAVTSATASLSSVDGDKVTPVPAHTTVDGAHVVLSWDDELAREKVFRVALNAAGAPDGSMLESAYGFDFRTSGGPKVTSVSIGAAGVDGNARAVVTFDQALRSDANVAGLASFGGGSATISRQGASQVVFALHNVPRCAAFSLSIGKGLVSEAGVVGTTDWAFGSRVNCRATRTIGYSVKGRPIQAYFYGAGDTTILFTGGIHGNEPSGTYLMQDWAAWLDANAYKIPAGKQVVVAPNLNPDGIAANQRYNAHNVNLDRNFPTSDWVTDITAAGGVFVPQGGGATPLSEPETQAIVGLTSSLHVRAEFSFHAQGSLVGANKVADSVAIGSAYAAAVHYGTVFYNPEETFGYTLTGEYETWMGEKFGTPAVLVELPTLNGRYFSRHQVELWNMVNL